MTNHRSIIGLDLSNEDVQYTDIKTLSDDVLRYSQFLTVSLYNELFSSNASSFEPAFSDSYLNSQILQSQFFGKMSPFSPQKSFQHFLDEIHWANHLRIPTLLVPSHTDNSIEYLKYVNTICSLSHANVWIEIDLDKDAWEKWNVIRSSVGYKLFIRPILRLSSIEIDINLLEIWRAEHIAGFIIPIDLFSHQNKFSRTLEIFVSSMMDFDLTFVLEGFQMNENDFIEAEQYLFWLEDSKMEMSEYERGTVPFRDTIQVPVQPLSDNLESIVYESFERDPFKYMKYKEALMLAIQDK